MIGGFNIGFTPQANLLVGWIWLCLAFVSGLILGLGFHRENWLGGYGSLRRRLYRLAHISFFGLGAVNLAFYLTVKSLGISAPGLSLAGFGFIVGAISMPVSCVLMAHFPRTRALFAIPVLSLLLAGTLTVATLLESNAPNTPRSYAPTFPDSTRMNLSAESAAERTHSKRFASPITSTILTFSDFYDLNRFTAFNASTLLHPHENHRLHRYEWRSGS